MAMAALFHEALAAGCRQKASDLYLTAGQRVWLRVDGQLVPFGAERVESSALLAWLEEKLGVSSLMRLQAREEVDFAFSHGSWRLRGNAFWQRGEPAAVLRFLPPAVPSLAALNLPARAALDRILALTSGLVLVCGPTGSGKTTTLAACLDAINQNEARHILTLEDPVEYVFTPARSLINQRELGRDFCSFPAALRSALREMPDVLLVGELRDRAALTTALMAAESGMLVFGTLHTRLAAEAPARIESFYEQGERACVREQVARVLQAVLAQKLLPASGGGRVAAVEVLLRELSVCSLIRQGKYEQLPSVMMRCQQAGMQTMERAVAQLYQEGRITAKTRERYQREKWGEREGGMTGGTFFV